MNWIRYERLKKTAIPVPIFEKEKHLVSSYNLLDLLLLCSSVFLNRFRTGSYVGFESFDGSTSIAEYWT